MNDADMLAYYKNTKNFKNRGTGDRFKDVANPIGKDGKQMTCHQCGSVEHFQKNCPQKSQR